MSDDILKAIVKSGWGSYATPEIEKYWTEVIKQVYAGDEGRKKLKQCTICLLERDDFGPKLKEIKCPTLVLHVNLN